MDAKDFLKDNIEIVRQVAEDLQYCKNRELRNKGLEIILYQTKRMGEHLEYLDVITDEEGLNNE